MLQQHRAGSRRKSKTRFLSCEHLESRQLLAVVMNLNDSGAGSLRQAIIDEPAGGTVTFSVSGQIVLTSGELVVDKALTIDGSGQTVAVSGNDASRVMRIDDSNDAAFVDVTLKNITIEDGQSTTDGAGIQSFENLTLDGVTVRNNEVGGGGQGEDAGGIAQGGETRPGGNLVIMNSTIEFNTAVDDAGALDHYNSNDLTIMNTVIRSNLSGTSFADTNAGTVGAIRIIDAVTPALYGDQDILFDNLTFTDNQTYINYDNGAALGGILVSAQPGQNWTMNVQDSTFTGNFHNIENGNASGYEDGRGGALYITDVAEVTISDSTFTGNYSYGPAGALQIANSDVSSTATLNNVTIDNNGDGAPFGFTGQTGQGGGLWVISFNAATTTNVTINDSRLTNNRATFGGGLLMQQGVSVTINDSVVTGNSANRGGGLYSNTFNPQANGDTDFLTLNRVTVDNNTAIFGGGGIQMGSAYGYKGNLTVNDSTISRNSAPNDGSGTALNYGYGGGINSEAAVISINQSTIADNTAYLSGGGIFGGYYSQEISISRSTITGNSANTSSTPYNYGGGLSLPFTYLGPHVLDNSIVAENTDLRVGGDADIGGSGAQVNSSFSFIGTASTTATVTDTGGSIIGGGSPQLGPLMNNGGGTETRLPMAGSPVINAGSGTRATGADQRGFTPGEVGVVDIGSVEVGAMGGVVNGDFNNDQLWNCDDINALSAAIASGSTDLSFDMNGDGMITLADITDAGSVPGPGAGWLAVGGAQNPVQTGGNAFLNGDANLSGGVDGGDFGIWNANKFSTTSSWCLGDFNASGGVDGGDFGIWNTNKFQSSMASRPSTGGVSFAAADLRGVLRTQAARQMMTPIGREVTAARVPQAAPTAIRVEAGLTQPLSAARKVSTSFASEAKPTEVTAVPAVQLAAVGSQHQMRSLETARTSAIEKVFADLESDELVL